MLADMINAGAWNIHLRKPGWSREELETWLNNCPGTIRDQLVIHHHADLAAKYSLKGVNFSFPGPENLPDNFKSLSLSVHSEDEVNRSEGFNYYLLSPVFTSISKPGYGPVNFDLSKIKNDRRIFALGGINPSAIKNLDSHFAGVAALGFIWNSESPVEAFKELKLALVNRF